MSQFEDHLWREVTHRHGPDIEFAGRPPARRPRRPQMLAGGSAVALAGVGVATALVLGGAGTSPAFAVTRHQDGTVTVWVTRPGGIAGANARLRELGIRAEVLPQAPVRCGNLPITQAPAPGGNVTGVHWTIVHNVPAGRMLALTPPASGPPSGPSLTPAPGPPASTDDPGDTETTGGTGTTGDGGTATTGADPGGAPGMVWTCKVPAPAASGAGSITVSATGTSAG